MKPSPNHPHRRPLCHLLALLTLLLSATGLLAQQAGTSPVKIFILAGQSNMEGQGEITPVTTPGTLEHTVANDPAGDYQFLVDGGGAWVVRDDVWIRDESPAQGGLTVGYGSNSGTVGPELGFGHFIGDVHENQVLIVKAAWGGKSLGVDFRPPSSGGTTGFYYNEIIRLVNEMTDDLDTDPSTFFPDYNFAGGYEIAGFCWHQGWNDRVDTNRSAEYETNMANFIRDIRTDLGAPGPALTFPFVIATTGMDGGDAYTVVEQAQLAMANTTTYPEFDGNVAVIDTRGSYGNWDFWQPEELSPQPQGYHWNRNAKTYVNIGLAMGDTMSIMAPGRCPFRPRAEGGPGGVTLTWQNGTETPTSVRVLRNSVEIAAAAPAGSASFLDATALPGVLNYELQFTMPGDPCDPLSTTFAGGITDLTLTPGPGGLTLDWTNNMGYTAIEVRRDATLLDGALSGTATTYTDTSPPSSGLVTYSVVPTTGSSTPATVQINLDIAGQLGVLDVIANGGINPATGSSWEVGDQYRLAFITRTTTNATSTDIATYNAFVQGVASTAGLGGGDWKVIGSTAAVDARDNTSTNPDTNGTGVPIFLVDGTTKVADNNIDLWNGNLDASISLDENAVFLVEDRVFTGSGANGVGRPIGGDGPLGDPGVVQTGRNDNPNGNWMTDWKMASTTSQSVYALSDPLSIINGADNTAPTLNSFQDNKTGGPVLVTETVTYTVSFSEAMKASTVGSDDFENASTAAITVGSVSPTADPAIFEVAVTPTGAGSLRLQVKPSAVMSDLAGNLLDAGTASPDDTIITVNPETTPPTLLSIADNVAGGPILVNETVTYTVTFSEPMNATTVGTADFDNAAAGAITVDSAVPTGDAAVFEVVVTATGAGNLQLRIAAGASLEDLSGNLLDAGSASPDDTVITVNTPPSLVGELGIFDVTANGGINPATGVAWAAGDQYRLVFVASGTTTCDSTDITTYNSFVQGLANAAGLGGATWNVVGSTATVDARDNTNTNPSGDGVGEPVLRMDGTFVIANDYADLWNGINNSHVAGENYLTVHLDEYGVERIHERVRTGTGGNGMATTDNGRVLGGSAEATSKVQTGRNYAPDFYGGLGGTNWMQDWNEPAANAGPVFAMSEPLTLIAVNNNTFTNWIGGFSGLGVLTAFTDDPDGDRLANGLEAWFGTHPGEFNAGLAELTVVNSTTITFSHPQNPDPPSDVSGFYQWSVNLTDWYAGDGEDGPPGGPTVTISPGPVGTTTTVTATPSEALGTLFLRAGVNQN